MATAGPGGCNGEPVEVTMGRMPHVVPCPQGRAVCLPALFDGLLRMFLCLWEERVCFQKCDLHYESPATLSQVLAGPELMASLRQHPGLCHCSLSSGALAVRA